MVSRIVIAPETTAPISPSHQWVRTNPVVPLNDRYPTVSAIVVTARTPMYGVRRTRITSVKNQDTRNDAAAIPSSHSA